VILIIGSRSRTGQELLRLLRAAGAPLRIMTRAADALDGSDIVAGDLAKPSSLASAMEGVDKVFLLSSPAHDERAWHRNAIDAARKAGVSLLVRSSILGADPGSVARLIRHHGISDIYLRNSGVPYTIIRPNFYMHNVTVGWPPTIDAAGNYYAPAGDAAISMTDARDVAAVAVAALTGSGHGGQIYDLTGPESLTHADACDKLGKRLGRTVRYVPVDDSVAQNAMLGAGMREWFVDALIELYREYRRSGPDGYAGQVHPTVAKITGEEPRTLEQALDADIPAALSAAD
jgi:uncharacterized protein YbjT (DUF2867 family)